MRRFCGRPAYLPEAVALFARMTTPPAVGRKLLINTTIRTLVAQGVWAKLDALYFTAAADSQAAKLNWISTSYNLTAINSPTFTADRGFAGDGATSWLDTTGYTGGSIAINSHAIGAWMNTDALDDGGAIGFTGGVSIQPNAGGALHVRDAGTTSNVTVSDGLGYSGVTRTSGAGITVQKNVTQTAKTAAVAGFGGGISYPLLVLRANSVILVSFSASRIAAAHLGTGLTTTELALLQAVMSSYLNAVGGA